MLRGGRHARARFERHREMQLRVILRIAPDAAPVGDNGNAESA